MTYIFNERQYSAVWPSITRKKPAPPNAYAFVESAGQILPNTSGPIPVRATRRSSVGLMPVYVYGTTAPIDNHVPEVWLSGDRNHADGCLCGLLGL